MRGVSEREIAAVLGKPTDKPFDQTSSAPALNIILERRTSTDALLPPSSPSPQSRATSVPRNLHSVVPVTTSATHTTSLSSRRSHSPYSITSSMGTPPSTSYYTPLYTAPMTSKAPEIKTEDLPYDYASEAYRIPWTYSNDHGYTPGVTEYQDTSCANAATIINTMRSDDDTRPVAEVAYPIPIRDYYSNATFDLDTHSYNHVDI
jgi:hypothetical protein